MKGSGVLIQSAFPARLQHLREKKGISRQVLADFCGISKKSIARYERGERLPDVDDAAKLAQYFGVSLDYLCGLSEHRSA